ncbi:alpha/beta hydrolase family protein [Bacillus sp. B1-b2]|uniref:alpha/beta hydrolase family protein n=1 Tax=Bacillus sp. B1-b2 TaxID=2653201 RepID=UPI00126233AA|nr:alpha/beta fold hydrolase [Bacillus sp. B1-b2]KAB7667087.1 alpha/beta hydrolase [Bacillus sp. B1-b2]
MESRESGKYRYYIQEPEIGISREKIVIIYHGWGGSAKGYSDLAQLIVNEGYTVIVPGIIYHDTREPFVHYFEKQVSQEYFWQTIMITVDEFHDFLNVLPIKLEDTIVIGSSMGGLIATSIFAKEPLIKGLVNVNGSGSFVVTEEIYRLRDKREKLPLMEEERLRNYDPKENHINKNPILLLHGENDTFMPIEGQIDYYNYLIETEKRTNIEFRIFENVNHRFTEEMIIAMVIWLNSNCL